MLDAPTPGRASTTSRSAGFKRGAAVTEMPLRRDPAYPDDYSDSYDSDPEFAPRNRKPALRVSIRAAMLPKTLWGRIATGAGFLLVAGAGIASILWVRSYLLHDDHFLVPSSESIQIAGNSHLTRPQLLSVFGEDVDRNIFNIPLTERRMELESLPWVAHATVMRLLPNRIRIAIVERSPVAFVRQGSRIGLVDANGVLFDLPTPDMEEASGVAQKAQTQYSFPVLSGIAAADPLSTRAARMNIYLGFMAALDATGEGISHKLSEVDLSNPEDVKALIPDANGTDILVHFGEEKYLERYHQYQQHLAEWRTQYPKLGSVDMRYEKQVVLEMQPGASAGAATTATVVNPPPAGAPIEPVPAAKAKPVAPKTAAPHVAPVKAKKPATKPKRKQAAIARKKTAGHGQIQGATAQGAPR
ncbi:MAG TPA: FtsQ-type POTRA domain-containing protein [Acidobacteriaceae bacterium]